MLVSVTVRPSDSRPGVDESHDGDSLLVRLASPPVDGKANKELCEVLARHFRVPKSSVAVIKGHTSKNKTVKILK